MQVEEAVSPQSTSAHTPKFGTISSAVLDELIKLLAEGGYRVVGPTIRDRQLVLDEIRGTDDLPAGWTDEHAPGQYRARRSDDGRFFDCLIGAHSWKQFLFPSTRVLWSANRVNRNGGVEFSPPEDSDVQYALLGVRACDLAAIAVQDRVFMDGEYPDPVYSQRRQSAFVIAVNCTRSASTCFCASLGTGPKATKHFDLALTEMHGSTRPSFYIETGSDRGAKLLDRLDLAPADEKTAKVVASLCERAAAAQVCSIDPETARQALIDHPSNSRWHQTAERCLACGNCTMVCPTCFCSTVEDSTDLTGLTAERRQVWDTCFHIDHSYLHGGSVRKSTSARYCQWITHKLATWYDQFGTTGCVGCGRCSTWCPVGIDITEEIEAVSPVTVTVATSGTKQQGKNNESR